MAHNRYVEGRLRLRGILDGEDDSRRCQEQDNDNEDRDDRPCELDLGTPIDLRGFAVRISLPGSVPDDGESQQSPDHQKDPSGNGEDEQ